jgi:CO dehydrogenase maturation factor
MRIAFHGKGGAGKTTTTAAFVRFVSKRHPFVLAVDADLNVHLQDALVIDGDAQHLGLCFEEICSYLAGYRKDLGGRPMICTTPPTAGSNFVRVSADDPFISKYALRAGNIALLTVGKYLQSDISTTCYHEKLKSIMGVFHHMLDGVGDIVVADTIAGTDNIATSLSYAFDLNVFVVEPTEKSIRVFQDYLELVPEYADRLFVIGNKVANPDDESFIAQRIPPSSYLGSLPYSRQLRHFEQGDSDAISAFDSQIQQVRVFDRLIEELKSKKRDWHAYMKKLRASYALDCERWYSQFLNCDLLDGIDETFAYENAIKDTAVLAR